MLTAASFLIREIVKVCGNSVCGIDSIINFFVKPDSLI